MANKNRLIDKTFLSLDLAEERGLIHRDYIAHCLRWSHVIKFLNHGHRYKDAIVLDVGCGKELPLAKTMYVNKMTPSYYVGVDANKFDVPDMLRGKKMPINVWSECDFCALDPEDVGMPLFNKDDECGPGYSDYAQPTILTCFEVLEHVTPEHCRRMLKHFLKLTSQDCHYFISTPCWNGSAAENHINEMTFAALGSLVEDVGFHIESVYGTFASISDYKDKLDDVGFYDKKTGEHIDHIDLRPVFDALRNYYDTNVLSVIFAPLFPEQSRNCLWHLTRKQGDEAAQVPMFDKLDMQPTPWSQHPDWKQLK